jgi:hypothetical protein
MHVSTSQQDDTWRRRSDTDPTQIKPLWAHLKVKSRIKKENTWANTRFCTYVYQPYAVLYVCVSNVYTCKQQNVSNLELDFCKKYVFQEGTKFVVIFV